MPTAGRLMAAILFAGLAWHVSRLAIGHLPEGLPMRHMPLWNALFAACIGWAYATTGPEAGIRSGIASGLTTGALVILVALLIHSGARMVGLAVRERYSGFLDGATDTFQLMFDYARMVAQPDVLLWAVIGSAAAGLFAAGAEKRWT